MKMFVNRINVRNGLAALFLGAVALSGGCVSVSNMTPGKMEWIQTASTEARAGKVYLIRGLIGVFSGGIDTLTEKIDKEGINAHVFQEDQKDIIAAKLAETYKNSADHEPISLQLQSTGTTTARSVFSITA